MKRKSSTYDKLRVTINSNTWLRDSNSMFDYENQKLTKKTIKTASECYLIRKGQEVTQTFQEVQDIGIKYLCHLQIYDGQFLISPSKIGERSPKNKINEKPHLVIKYLNSNKGYMVTEGDVIKMGRLKFRVKELKGADPDKRIKDFNLKDLVAMKEESDESDDDGNSHTFSLPCRICLSESYDDENPLICPCNCDGTMKYIHLKCLQRALRSRFTSRSTETALSFSWKSMSCDLCKRPYPYNFMLNGKAVELIKIPKPPEKYVILEGLCSEKNSSKWLHVISLNSKDSIKFGRANDCELKMTDISVSRLHGMIRLIGGSFYLEDKGSKFGTLIQIKRPISLENFENLAIQSGRTLLEFSIKKPWSFLPSCFKSSSSSYEVFVSSLNSVSVPIYPVGTGIPLSIDNPEELKSKMMRKKSDCKVFSDNLMFEHGQLGINSSFEEENMEGVENIQEVQVANQDYDEITPINSEPSEEHKSCDIIERSHSII